MKVKTIKGISYKLPGSLTEFQEDMYVHLINWKWKHIIKEPGNYGGVKYDAILPDWTKFYSPIIYRPIFDEVYEHLKKYKFKFHTHFNHMASSQAANINLFLPILNSADSNKILQVIKPDFKMLANKELHKGYRIEYWDGNSDKDKGLLGDHNARSGTDSDIGIAYYNHYDELCLWLIEHKLTEKEFTTCGGFKSNGRDKSKHLCSKSFTEILDNKDYCYYHNVRKNEYWNITDNNQPFFKNHHLYKSCPFKGGMNQLWRNQLLAMAVEDQGHFKNVYFSVVHHPNNHALDKSMDDYKNLVDNHPKYPKFSSFTSHDVINAAGRSTDKGIKTWITWYKDLYKV